MEASSHGLKQNRLDGLKFSPGIFTNLSQDHLDYHKSLKNYLRAKLYLFEKLVSTRGNLITDQKIPQFQKIKKVALKRNLRIHSISDKKKFIHILSHEFIGETQLIKVKYKNIIKNIRINLVKFN